MNKAGIAKQLQQCLKNLPKFSDGQVLLTECDWDNLEHVKIEISPNEGIYKGGIYEFKILLDYSPAYPPTVECLTNIFHPNITPQSEGGSVCLSLLDDWTENNTLEDLIMGLLFLMYNPNISDPLSSYTPRDQEEFEKHHNMVMSKEEFEVQHGGELDASHFHGAKDKYDQLLPEEWDVLRLAADAEHAYNLEQETWKKKVEKWQEEQRMQEMFDKLQRFIDDNYEKCTNKGEGTSWVVAEQAEKVDYAYEKCNLQKFNTVTAPLGYAKAVQYDPPDQETLNEWATVQNAKKAIRAKDNESKMNEDGNKSNDDGRKENSQEEVINDGDEKKSDEEEKNPDENEKKCEEEKKTEENEKKNEEEMKNDDGEKNDNEEEKNDEKNDDEEEKNEEEDMDCNDSQSSHSSCVSEPFSSFEPQVQKASIHKTLTC